MVSRVIRRIRSVRRVRDARLEHYRSFCRDEHAVSLLPETTEVTSLIEVVF